MTGGTNAPIVEWFDLYHCPDCDTRAFLQGLRAQRSLKFLFMRIPLRRRWYLRCQSCSSTQRVDEKTWRQRRETGVTLQEAYLARQRTYVLAQRN